MPRCTQFFRRDVRRGHLGALAFVASVASVSALMLAHSAQGGAPGPEPDAKEATKSAVESPPEPDERNVIAVDPTAAAREPDPPRPTLDPAARMVEGNNASEYWMLYIELDSGHRITQQFLISNAGPGNHNAVASGHLLERGREPFRYVNGRREGDWKLSEDRLFFDISASHLDLHRPTGELRITKDEIEIRLFFDFANDQTARSIPRADLPETYHVELLALAAATRGTIHAPWMTEPLETTGRTWLTHTWTQRGEAELLDRRVDFFGYENGTSFYGIHLSGGKKFERTWLIADSESRFVDSVIESSINIPGNWSEQMGAATSREADSYPAPAEFTFSGGAMSGRITLGPEWLRFDPLDVLPQPFRWFVRRKTKPREVWAEARIGVRLLPVPETPSLPDAGATESKTEHQTESGSNSNRETEVKTAERSVAGVASITFMNPSRDR